MYNLATVETVGLTPALVIADIAAKAADIIVVGIEGDAGLRAMVKMVGDAANCAIAVDAARLAAEQMHAEFHVSLNLRFADSQKVRMVESPQEYSPINEGFAHMLPKESKSEMNMKAIGILETQGLTGMIEGADAMLKAADVELLGKEKIGAAHVTVIVQGDVAAVKAAIEAGVEAVNKVGTLVAAHVIARPHEALAKLLPQ